MLDSPRMNGWCTGMNTFRSWGVGHDRPSQQCWTHPECTDGVPVWICLEVEEVGTTDLVNNVGLTQNAVELQTKLDHLRWGIEPVEIIPCGGVGATLFFWLDLSPSRFTLSTVPVPYSEKIGILLYFTETVPVRYLKFIPILVTDRDCLFPVRVTLQRIRG